MVPALKKRGVADDDVELVMANCRIARECGECQPVCHSALEGVAQDYAQAKAHGYSNCLLVEFEAACR